MKKLIFFVWLLFLFGSCAPESDFSSSGSSGENSNPALPNSNITWTVSSSCSEGQIDFRFFDDTLNLVWPGNNQVYFVENGDTRSESITCRAGNRICFGASLRSNNYNSYWGIGIEGNLGCTDCCYRCQDNAEIPVRNLICP